MRIEMAFKRIFIPIFFVLAFCLTSTKADDGGYWGTVLQIGAANYVIQMDDGGLLDVECVSGYDNWWRGDRVILTTESGGGCISALFAWNVFGSELPSAPSP